MVLLPITGGRVGLTSVAVALSASKAGKLHRNSGMVFVYARLVMLLRFDWLARVLFTPWQLHA